MVEYGAIDEVLETNIRNAPIPSYDYSKTIINIFRNIKQLRNPAPEGTPRSWCAHEDIAQVRERLTASRRTPLVTTLFSDFFRSVLNVKIPERIIGIDCGVFEGFVIADSKRDIVNGFECLETD